ncbi:recombinase family protein [Sphingomonas sp. 2378]|uniref:recombinase family protein n=1 Tax=Sphingomonas sp. 2378 TaxID=1219748 RepID=UPI00311AC386
MLRAAIYARFSSERQSATSAEDQIALCTERARREGWEVAGVYTDIAISGASNRRPGMTALLADASAGAFDIVLSEAIDRISRNQADIATIFQRLEFANVPIETLSEGRITEMHIGFKGTMSAVFLKDLADKIRRGQRGAVSRGRIPGGLAYGYRVVPRINDRGELDRGLREIVPEEAAVIRRVYREYLAGRSPKAIAHDLNCEGIPSPAGGEWRASSIAGHRARRLGMLHNPIYAGRFLYGRVTMKRDPDSRKRISRVTSSEDQVMVDMPELRIVDEETWQAVQDQTEQRATGPMGQHKRPRHLLSGLITCGKCGGSVSIVGGKRLGCIRHREAGTCEVRKTICREELEGRVLAGIVNNLLSPEAISLLVQRYHVKAAEYEKRDRESLDAIDKRLGAAERAIARLVAAIAEGAADFTEIREALAARKADRDSLIRQRQELAADSVVIMNPGVVDDYRRRVKSLSRTLDESTGVEQAEVKQRLRDLIEGVKIRPTNTDWDIEVLSSLGSAVALATSPQNPRRGSGKSAPVVAKEGLEPPTRGL